MPWARWVSREADQRECNLAEAWEARQQELSEEPPRSSSAAAERSAGVGGEEVGGVVDVVADVDDVADVGDGVVPEDVAACDVEGGDVIMPTVVHPLQNAQALHCSPENNTDFRALLLKIREY